MNEAVARYAAATRSTRLHTRLRWWSCPFPAIEAHVPWDGDVLEVGCSHGLLALHLALSAPGRRVRGVDIDPDKIAAARAAAGGAASFDVVLPGFVPSEPCDAVVIADVLYLLSPHEQRRLLAAAAETLRPGGVVVAKEMALEPRWKLRWTRFQETVATRVLRITDHMGTGLNFIPPAVMADWLRAERLDVTIRRVDKGYPWPHVLLVGRKARQ